MGARRCWDRAQTDNVASVLGVCRPHQLFQNKTKAAVCPPDYMYIVIRDNRCSVASSIPLTVIFAMAMWGSSSSTVLGVAERPFCRTWFCATSVCTARLLWRWLALITATLLDGQSPSLGLLSASNSTRRGTTLAHQHPGPYRGGHLLPYPAAVSAGGVAATNGSHLLG